jgi:hypothetical protein
MGAGQERTIDHGGLENLTHAQWMPDGNRLLLSGNEAGRPTRCYLLDPSSGAREAVGPEGIWEGYPSPDGTSFIARTRDGWMICPASATQEGRPIPSMVPADYMIRWSPNASAVFTFRRGEVPSPVDRIDVASGSRETIAQVGDTKTPGLVGILALSLADDLRTMAYGTWLYTSVLYIVGLEQREHTR